LSIAPPAQTFSANGGNGTVSVNVPADCSWTATSGAAWITVASGTSGIGSGEIHFVVAANPNTASRQGVLTIGTRTFTVAQAGLSCTYAIQPASQAIAAAGGPVTIALTAPAACAWTAHANTSWISIVGAASGSGSASVTVNVAANSGDARTGTVSIADQTFSINQASAPCSFSITPASQSIAASGGSGTISVAAGQGCAWTAVSNAAWITISSGASGAGAGTVSFSVASNGGVARAGTLTIGAQTFTVNQAAACSFTIAPASQTIAETGGSGTVAVTADSGCAWTASSDAAWIAITGASSGTGNGSVAFTVDANAGAARSGTLAIAGQTFTVMQTAAPPPPPCSFSLAPTSATVPAAGGTQTVAITTSSACGWKAVSNADWMTITSGASGTGSGTVQVAIAANTGPSRIGTMTIADQTFTVTQREP